ncbi:hypothetical protein F4779DRAFT_89923 [Xylariaceae sp. FL0662B]|nr:hypothetical protein F4779DRAFT_89923 [Xylariaceae sp. FL0662B]
MKSYMISESDPLPSTVLLQHMVRAGVLDELSNHPGDARAKLFHNQLRNKKTGRFRKAFMFFVYQSSRYGPQNGFRLCLVNPEYYMGSPTKIDASVQDDFDYLEKPIPQGHMEIVILGETPPPIEDPDSEDEIDRIPPMDLERATDIVNKDPRCRHAKIESEQDMLELAMLMSITCYTPSVTSDDVSDTDEIAEQEIKASPNNVITTHQNAAQDIRTPSDNIAAIHQTAEQKAGAPSDDAVPTQQTVGQEMDTPMENAQMAVHLVNEDSNIHVEDGEANAHSDDKDAGKETLEAPTLLSVPHTSFRVVTATQQTVDQAETPLAGHTVEASHSGNRDG